MLPSVPPMLRAIIRPDLEGIKDLVANNWNPSLAGIFSPRLGMKSVLDSSNGNRTERTSMGAKSISSIKSHFPSRTAVVRTPACHLNDPGVDVET